MTTHYDAAWVGFDIGLFCAISLTAWAAYRNSIKLVPFAAATCALLIADAWFDVVTSLPGERLEAALEAGLAELPLAAICGYVVYDVEGVHASVRLLRKR